MRIRYLRRPTHRQVCYWLDLDNTLHDASRHILPAINQAMTQYVARQLNMPLDEASRIRNRYWLAYGATLLGLIKHHDIDALHFLEQTHQLPDLHEQLIKVRSVRHHLPRLQGTRILLTNAPRDYAERVLRSLGLHKSLHAVVTVEDMKVHGHWRPKPSAWLWKHLKRTHSGRRHVLVEDTVGHLVSAAPCGFSTAWIAPRHMSGSKHRQAARPASVDCRVRRFDQFAAWASRLPQTRQPGSR